MINHGGAILDRSKIVFCIYLLSGSKFGKVYKNKCIEKPSFKKMFAFLAFCQISAWKKKGKHSKLNWMHSTKSRTRGVGIERGILLRSKIGLVTFYFEILLMIDDWCYLFSCLNLRIIQINKWFLAFYYSALGCSIISQGENNWLIFYNFLINSDHTHQ